VEGCVGLLAVRFAPISGRLGATVIIVALWSR
jgi:hypothetical protein